LKITPSWWGPPVAGDLQRLWQVKTPDSYHLEYGYSCMGYEIAAAIGAKLAKPQQPVYAAVETAHT
jgi:3D-(3,5/4)-trihydroxycyclohexane-1,2-dione acylhydrolase (decyclizing)